MLVLYLFGSWRSNPCPQRSVLCISCTVAGSYAIKWVALSIILTYCKLCRNSTFGKRIWHQAILLAANCLDVRRCNE